MQKIILSIADDRVNKALKTNQTAIEDFRKSILKLTTDLRSTQVGLPEQQFSVIQANAYDLYKKVQGGDAQAMSDLPAAVNAYFEKINELYASSDQGTALKNQALAMLDVLPDNIKPMDAATETLGVNKQQLTVLQQIRDSLMFARNNNPDSPNFMGPPDYSAYNAASQNFVGAQQDPVAAYASSLGVGNLGLDSQNLSAQFIALYPYSRAMDSVPQAEKDAWHHAFDLAHIQPPFAFADGGAFTRYAYADSPDLGDVRRAVIADIKSLQTTKG